MKKITAVIFLIVCIGTIGAADLESYDFINRLLGLGGPVPPVIYEDAVIFTASSSYRRVGISFEYEGFSKVYWLQKLLLPGNTAADSRKKNTENDHDSGILFHVQVIPEDIRELNYRMIIDGLWTSDPLNPANPKNAATIHNPAAISVSSVSVPARLNPVPTAGIPAGLQLSFNAPPGEIITVGGSFNNWDPFMYQMKETKKGYYTLNLSLPPGTYQYVFFYRGERYLDPNNPDRIYTKDGKPASQALVTALTS